jgi:hypothetical protein
MMGKKDDTDIIFMEKIEDISKKISDLINVGKYESIPILDNKRLELIRKFNDKNNKYFQKIISQIKANNVKNIEVIELKHKNLKVERSKFMKRLKAYNY